MQDLEKILVKLKDMFGQTESLRLATRKSIRISWLIIVVVVLTGISCSFLLFNAAYFRLFYFAFILTLIVALGIYAGYILTPLDVFRKRFKKIFIPNLMVNLAKNVRYVPDGDRRVLSHYRNSNLFKVESDREHIEDTIFARIGNAEFLLSELHTEFVTKSTDKNGNETSSASTIFRGVFFSADFHKHFVGQTFVRSEFGEKYFGRLGRFFQKAKSPGFRLADMESREFEREFIVETSDQVEARYILSPSMMERILLLKKKFKSKIDFAFVNSRLYIAIWTKKNWFEPKLNKKSDDLKYLGTLAYEILAFIGIVEELDLNTRVWSKN